MDTVIVQLCERIGAIKPPSMPPVLLEPPLDLTVRLRIVTLRRDVFDASHTQIPLKSADTFALLLATACIELSASIRINLDYTATIRFGCIFRTLKCRYGVFCGCMCEFADRENLSRGIVLERDHLEPVIVQPIGVHQRKTVLSFLSAAFALLLLLRVLSRQPHRKQMLMDLILRNIPLIMPLYVVPK